MIRSTGVLEILYGGLLVHTGFHFLWLFAGLLGLSQCLRRAGRGRQGECVRKQRGEEGRADGTRTGAAKGSAIPTGAPGVSRTRLHIPKDKGSWAKHHVWLEQNPRLRDEKEIRVKKLQTNFSEAPCSLWRLDTSQSLGSKLHRRDTWQMKFKGRLSVSIKCPAKDKKQDTLPIIQVWTLRLGPSPCPAITVQMFFLERKRRME